MTARFGPGRGSGLTKSDRQAIQELALIDGLSQSEIARRTGRDRGTVASVLKAEETKVLASQLAADQKDRARAILHRNTASAAEAWHEAVAVGARKGDHRPARDLLLHTDVISPIETTGGRIAVAVILNGGALPDELRSGPSIGSSSPAGHRPSPEDET